MKTKFFAVLLSTAILFLTLTSCGGRTEPVEPDPNLLSVVFEKLCASEDYNLFKEINNSANISEKLDGSSIIISAPDNEGQKGDYVFTLEGDRIVHSSEEEDYTSYMLMTFIRDAVADMYDMDVHLMNGYIEGLSYSGKKNIFFSADTDEGKTVYRLYAASEWDMAGLEKMYVNSAVLRDWAADGATPWEIYFSFGKITAAVFGDRNLFYIIIGEYGRQNTELTLKSIHAIIKKLQSPDYKDFIKSFDHLTSLEYNRNEIDMRDPENASLSTEYSYYVDYGVTEDAAARADFVPVENYSYMTVTFTVGG